MSNAKEDNDLRAEYDFSNGERGRHFRAYREETNVVMIAPELHKLFPDAEAVNQALAAYAREHHLIDA
jgi:hypothetical protein